MFPGAWVVNHAEYERMTRWRRTAQTWLAKSAMMLNYNADEPNVNVRAVIEYEATALVNAMLYECESLIHLVDPDDIEEVAQLAKKVSSACRARMMAEKLAKVEGRTPEEAATFTSAAKRFAKL